MEDHHRRRCTTVRQLELLVEFLCGHKDLALGRLKSKEARALGTRLWSECAEILNVEGPARTAKEWAKVWNDNKSKVRNKVTTINACLQATGGGTDNAAPLSALEEKIAAIIGKEIGPLPNVRQDQFAAISEDALIEAVTEDFEVEDVHLNEYQVQEFPSSITADPEADPGHGHAVANTPTVAPSPTPTSTSRVTRSVRERRRAERSTRQPLARARAPAQSSRTALDESRRMVLDIEEMKAQSDLKIAEAFNSFAQSFKLIAESIDRFTRVITREDRT